MPKLGKNALFLLVIQPPLTTLKPMAKLSVIIAAFKKCFVPMLSLLLEPIRTLIWLLLSLHTITQSSSTLSSEATIYALVAGVLDIRKGIALVPPM